MKNQSTGQRPARNQLYLEGVVYNGEKTLDMMIPGNKVGIVIGKGGEMIRTLQVGPLHLVPLPIPLFCLRLRC